MERCSCTKEAEIAAIQSEVKTLFRTTEKHRDDIRDLNKTYELIRELTTSVSVLAEQMRRNTEDIGEVKKDVEVIKSKPAKALEHYKKLILGGIITTILGAILGAILAMVLL